MSAPIRTSEQIQIIINNGQQALCGITNTVVVEKKRGVTIAKTSHRDNVYRMILLWVYLQNILEPNGDIRPDYLTSANEKKFNTILDGIVNLSKGFAGPAIALLGRKNFPIAFFPGTSGPSPSSGGGPATPGGTVFSTVANSPSTLIDAFDASISSFAFYIISISGTGSGEGSRTSIMSATWRGSNTPVYTETKTEDVGGDTSPVTLKIELAAGKIQLNAYTTTDNWSITGLRILFQNISFVNPLGPLPPGGTTGQILAKTSNIDYQAAWETLTANLITDLTASATELNYSQGVTSSIQAQFNTLVANLAAEAVTRAAADSSEATTRAAADLLRLLLTGGTMTGPIAMSNNKITGAAPGTTTGDVATYEQLPPVITKVIQIGDWNMHIIPHTKFVASGLADTKKIRTIQVIVRDDADAVYTDLLQALGHTAGISDWVPGPNIELYNTIGDFFDNTNYDATSYNRGWITITYEP